MTSEEKEVQVKTAERKIETSAVNDIDTLHPEPKSFNLAGRSYWITPLKLKDMRLLVKLSKAKLGKDMDEGDLQLMIDSVAQILKEPDKNFIEENLDIPTMTNLFKIVESVNYNNIPIQKGKPEGN